MGHGDPIVYVNGFYYVIGGYTDVNKYDKTIGRLNADTMTWSKSGDLVNGRRGHNAIYDGSSLIVDGGYAGDDIALKTEKCVISNGHVSCSSQNPELKNYSYYPELFLVPIDYCKTLP